MKNDFNGCFNTFEGGQDWFISGSFLRKNATGGCEASLAMKMGISCIGW